MVFVFFFQISSGFRIKSQVSLYFSIDASTNNTYCFNITNYCETSYELFDSI